MTLEEEFGKEVIEKAKHLFHNKILATGNTASQYFGMTWEQMAYHDTGIQKNWCIYAKNHPNEHIVPPSNMPEQPLSLEEEFGPALVAQAKKAFEDHCKSFHLDATWEETTLKRNWCVHMKQVNTFFVKTKQAPLRILNTTRQQPKHV